MNSNMLRNNLFQISFWIFYSEGEIFENIDESVLKVALRILQRDKKAEIIGDDGVKFFWTFLLINSIQKRDYLNKF